MQVKYNRDAPRLEPVPRLVDGGDRVGVALELWTFGEIREEPGHILRETLGESTCAFR